MDGLLLTVTRLTYTWECVLDTIVLSVLYLVIFYCPVIIHEHTIHLVISKICNFYLPSCVLYLWSFTCMLFLVRKEWILW